MTTGGEAGEEEEDLGEEEVLGGEEVLGEKEILISVGTVPFQIAEGAASEEEGVVLGEVRRHGGVGEAIGAATDFEAVEGDSIISEAKCQN